MCRRRGELDGAAASPLRRPAVAEKTRSSVRFDTARALGAKNPTLCYLYVSGADGTRNLTSELPSDLVQRELALSDRVIATAARRQAIPDYLSNPLWEKVGLQIAKRVGAEKLELLHKPKPDPTKYSDYCGVWTAFFQEVTNLEQDQAGILMRQVLSKR
jgi:hypothetical protein